MSIKYKLINTQTKEETICEKVVLDSFEYYVSDNYARMGSFITDGKEIEEVVYRDMITEDYSIQPKGRTPMSQHRPIMKWETILATNNPNIKGIPKVIDEVVKLAEEDADSYDWNFESSDGNGYVDQVEGFKNGYNKSQETHPNSDEDMIEFAEWYFRETFNTELHNDFKSTKELLDIWKSQQPITIYYGEKI